MDNREQEILDAAEQMVREGGYNSFSFRDIATAVGVKSSSVHYHFPTKADLGAAVAKYYTDKFLGQMGTPEALLEKDKDPIKTYTKAFKKSLTKDKRMCLCGLLGAEIEGLPNEVVIETRTSFERNIEWLTAAYTLRDGKKKSKSRAMQTYSLLEGAMMMSVVLDNVKAFDEVALAVEKI